MAMATSESGTLTEGMSFQQTQGGLSMKGVRSEVALAEVASSCLQKLPQVAFTGVRK